MQTIYRINADELDQNLLDSIKVLFQHKEIEIVISECDANPSLRHSFASRESLLHDVPDAEEYLDIFQ